MVPERSAVLVAADVFDLEGGRAGDLLQLRRGVCWPASVVLTSSIVLLALLYLSIPDTLIEPPGWTPQSGHAAQVAQLYRAHLAWPLPQVTADQLRVWNPTLLVLAALSYGLAVWSRPDGLRWRSLAALSLPLAAASLFMPPLYATDIFFYGVMGEIAVRFGGNPYLLTPADVPTSALLPFNYWTFISTPYGSVWTSVSAAAAYVSAGDPFLCTLLLKLVGLMAVIGASVAIGAFLSATHPRAAAFGTGMFLLNPFVWLDAVGNAHADALVAALTVAAAALLARRHTLGAWCCLGVATLAKYVTGPVLLLFWLTRLRSAASRRAGLRLALVLGGSLAALTIIGWMPYWAGPRTLSSLLDERSRGYGPVLLLLGMAGEALDLPDWVVATAVGLAASLLLLALALAFAWAARYAYRTCFTSSVVDEVRTWALTLTAVAALLPRTHPWYALTGMALLAAVHPKARRTSILVYAATGVWLLWRVGRI